MGSIIIFEEYRLQTALLLAASLPSCLVLLSVRGKSVCQSEKSYKFLSVVVEMSLDSLLLSHGKELNQLVATIRGKVECFEADVGRSRRGSLAGLNVIEHSASQVSSTSSKLEAFVDGLNQNLEGVIDRIQNKDLLRLVKHSFDHRKSFEYFFYKQSELLRKNKKLGAEIDSAETELEGLRREEAALMKITLAEANKRKDAVIAWALKMDLADKRRAKLKSVLAGMRTIIEKAQEREGRTFEDWMLILRKKEKLKRQKMKLKKEIEELSHFVKRLKKENKCLKASQELAVKKNCRQWGGIKVLEHHN